MCSSALSRFPATLLVLLELNCQDHHSLRVIKNIGVAMATKAAMPLKC